MTERRTNEEIPRAGGRGRRMASGVARLRLRLPLLWLLTGAIVVIGLVGIARLSFDDELVRFFESDIPAYHDYVELGDAFEGDSNDVIALVEADDLAAPDVVAALSDFVLDAQFVPGVRAVISPFALRLDNGPLFPYPPAAQADMAARIGKLRAETPLLGRMMSADRKAMLVIFPISEPEHDAQEARRRVIAALTTLADRVETASTAKMRFSGYPVLRDEISRALTHDIIVLNVFGLIVGFAIAAVALRSVRLALLTLPGPIIAVSFGIGLHGLLGVNINSITVTLPVLILVLATSDSIHISFERGRQGGRDSARATARAIRRVAVACIFASVTTAIAFAALTTSESAIISELGWMGVVLTLSSVFVVLLTQFVVLTTAGRWGWCREKFERLHQHPPRALWLDRLPALGLRHPKAITWTSLIVLALSTWAYSQAGPRYSILDSLRKNSPVRTVFEAIEDKVAPVSQIYVVVNATDAETVRHVADVVARATGSPFVQSLAEIHGGAETVGKALPGPLARRLVSADGTKALVSVPFRYDTGQQALGLADRIETALANEPGLKPGVIQSVTGLSVMSARVAGVILNEINRSLLIALVGVAVLIMIWLRNLRVALISLLPNMLPVSLIGGWLMYSGAGIEFPNALALTVAFGIAVDDTLHVLNRLALSGGVTQISRERLESAYREVTPALVTTSVVLFLGMSGGFFAENQGVADFSKIAMSVFVLALVADLLILPAALATFGPNSYLKNKRHVS